MTTATPDNIPLPSSTEVSNTTPLPMQPPLQYIPIPATQGSVHARGMGFCIFVASVNLVLIVLNLFGVLYTLGGLVERGVIIP